MVLASLTSSALWTVLLAQAATLFGLWLTYRRNREMFAYQKRKEASLQRLTSQLSEFYGPLYLWLNHSRLAFSLFIDSLHEGDQATSEAVMTEMILPTNSKIQTLIWERSHLLDREDDLSHYQAFLLHADVTRLRFSAKQLAPNLSIRFPDDLPKHVKALYNRKRQEYLSLFTEEQ